MVHGRGHGPAQLVHAARRFRNKDIIESAHEHLCAHFETERLELLASLIEQFPHRKRFFESAFLAHERKDYPCSVPLFLAQDDSICHEVTTKQLYAKKRGSDVPDVASMLAPLLEDGFLITSLITPLIETTPMTANPKQRAVLPADILNRHAVLHGESTIYDTRLNSCRAMSLLQYVAWVLAHVQSDRRRQGEGGGTR